MCDQVKVGVKEVSVGQLSKVLIGQSNQLDLENLNALHDLGSVVNSSIAIAATTGKIGQNDSNL